MIAKPEFYKRIRQLKTFKSKTGKASYSELALDDNILSFKRDKTNKCWKLNADEVYLAYSKETFLNTITIRKYVEGRAFSPSVGLLMAIGLCDSIGNTKK